LIEDPQGAHLVLLHAKGGDPGDAEPAIGEWLWNETWSVFPDKTADFYRSLGRYSSTLRGNGYVVLINEGKWRAGVRRVDQDAFGGRWIPVVRVEDPVPLLEKVKELGGLVLVRPEENHNRTALISDNTGALLMLQQWTFPAKGEER
jgi:predicted enzyme related to lactoylglutathione lyase